MHYFVGILFFNAGVGNCHNGGNPLSLYNTFYNQLIKLDKKQKYIQVMII